MQEQDFYSFLNGFELDTIKHNAKLLEGEPHTEILNYIKQHNTDLLLMGTTGKPV
ncbi:MAG: universal stress protein [Bacteroidales bacterium]|nr:universal stress protein [Bacteroidales bacterium]